MNPSFVTYLFINRAVKPVSVFLSLWYAIVCLLICLSVCMSVHPLSVPSMAVVTAGSLSVLPRFSMRLFVSVCLSFPHFVVSI